MNGLSERQLQILGMLRAGKVNKEIANELGIGLGTVKQHVVALFKKLNVRNRAMAVSRGAEILHGSRKPMLDQALLEYRPCIVVSLVLILDGSEDELATSGRRLQQAMAACAFDHDAILLARHQNGGDLIFGIQRSSEALVLEALRAAYQVARTILDSPECAKGHLHGGIESGLSVASMYRSGGWSGDAIASSAIASARQLAAASSAGTVALSPATRALARSLSPGSIVEDFPDSFSFGELADVPWQIRSEVPGRHRGPRLIGREAELMRIAELLADARRGAGSVVYVEGESGMGKSAFCDAVLELAKASKAAPGPRRVICHDYGRDRCYFDLAVGKSVALADLSTDFRAQAPRLWVFDDCHTLPARSLAELIDLVVDSQNQLVLLCGRRSSLIASRVSECIKLGRLSASAIRQILALVAPTASADAVSDVIRFAMGVPLFAVELAQHGSDPLPLSPRLVVGARLDRLKLDRLLLRQVAEEPASWRPDQLACHLHEDVATVRAGLERAVASGVLSCGDEQSYSFSHPLLRQVVLQAKVE